MENSIDYYKWKLKKLKMIVDLCAPDTAQTHEEMHPTAAISAVTEMNKMQGHYIKTEADHESEQELKSISLLLKELKAKHEKDY